MSGAQTSSALETDFAYNTTDSNLGLLRFCIATTKHYPPSLSGEDLLSESAMWVTLNSMARELSLECVYCVEFLVLFRVKVTCTDTQMNK